MLILLSLWVWLHGASLNLEIERLNRLLAIDASQLKRNVASISYVDITLILSKDVIPLSLIRLAICLQLLLGVGSIDNVVTNLDQLLGL